ncbi:MAG: sigma-70 family RNA polymerase sigma factor [Candidatus Baltobacteraceae bacterium]
MSADEREERIRGLFDLVKRLAARVHRLIPGTDRQDLVGDGCVGAIRAVDHFDPARGVPLEHYAGRVIVGAMLNGVRSMDTVPERVRREIRAADRERYAIASATGTFPSQPEMERRRPALRRAMALAARYSPLSLDGPLPPGEYVGADWSSDPGRIVADRVRREEIRAALHLLGERQRRILVLHYFDGHSLNNIGRMLHISSQRASQLHIAGMKKLRAVMHAAH